jgi:hypothetical protein
LTTECSGISGPKGDEIIGGWRTQDSEELHNLCSSPSIIRMTKSRRMRLAGQVENVYRISICRPRRKRRLGRARRRWECDRKLNHKDLRCGDMNWVDLIWDSVQWKALLNTVMNVQVP